MTILRGNTSVYHDTYWSHIIHKSNNIVIARSLSVVLKTDHWSKLTHNSLHTECTCVIPQGTISYPAEATLNDRLYYGYTLKITALRQPQAISTTLQDSGPPCNLHRLTDQTNLTDPNIKYTARTPAWRAYKTTENLKNLVGRTQEVTNQQHITST